MHRHVDRLLAPVALAFTSWSCATNHTPPSVSAGSVVVHASVFDSSTMSPLRGAHVRLIADDTVAAITDSAGAFEVESRSGLRRVEIDHPRFDSLRVRIPPQTRAITNQPGARVDLATPSAAGLSRVLCSDSTSSPSATIVGLVRDARNGRPMDSAFVVVKWLDLTLFRGAFQKSAETQLARTANGGWYVLCHIPSNASVIAWAEYGGAISGAVPIELGVGPRRLDLSVDRSALAFGGSLDLDPNSGESLFPLANGAALYRVFVQNGGGVPVRNARVRLLGRPSHYTNDLGGATMDSVAGGTQTLEISAMGYLPQRRTIEIAPSWPVADTIVLVSTKTLLDTVKVIANRGLDSFDGRRALGRGQFITGADVEQETPT